MKVSSTELPPRQVSLAIEVEQERLDRAVDDALRRHVAFTIPISMSYDFGLTQFTLPGGGGRVP